jgi:hypothetical protein
MKKNLSGRSVRSAPQFLGLLLLSSAGFSLLLAGSVQAEFVKFVDESFTGTTAPGWEFVKGPQHETFVNHGASLTAALGGPDSPGPGWLRLTQDTAWQSSFVHYTGQEENWKGIPTKWGLVFEFDFVIWRVSGSAPGDGFALVIFDANVDPSPGAYGGSLGYAQRSVANEDPVPGLAGGIVGIGFDAFGNFSRANEGRVGGALPTTPEPRRRNSIAIRGSHNVGGGYEYQAGTGDGAVWDTQNLAWSTELTNLSKAGAPNRTNATIHSVRITIPTTQLVTIEWHQGDGDWQPVLEHDCTLVSPEFIKFGFTAGTGSRTANIEVRNLEVRSAQAIPEPGSISLALGVGLVALGLWRRRRAATGG